MAGFVADPLSFFWIAIDVVYTSCLLLGLYYLYLHRQHTAVRIRSFPVICSAVLSLHVYLGLIPLGYPIGSLFPCGAEFWVMSIAFPIGLGLFQGEDHKLLPL